MKILHIWNTAGMGSILAKYHNRDGIESKVIHREACNSLGFPCDINVKGSAKTFYLKSLYHARKFDICHVHSVDKIVKLLRRLYPRKKIVLTYHGTDIRKRWEEKEKYWKFADLITITTPDLQPKDFTVLYTPCPVDVEHFKREQEFVPNSALFLWSNYSQMALDRVRSESERLGFHLIIQDYSKVKFKYSVYPRFLEIFEHYFDVKECFGKINPAMSLTGLQMLYLGVKVFYLGKWIQGTTKKHNSKVQVKKWIDIYENL